ncbi:MAG: hypothetical protein ACFCU4_06760 [Puniceicoccaceae bacterium]
MKRLFDYLKANDSWVVFLATAGYGFCVSSLVLFFLIPTFLGDRASKEGLVDGLDSGAFHELAVVQREEMVREGLGAWKLNPGWSDNQPAGIASLVYWVFWPHPGWMLPLNALLHGLAGMALYRILRLIGFGKLASGIGILPMVVFPSNLTWLAQIHKDGFFIAGYYLYLWGGLRLMHREGLRLWTVKSVGLVVGGAWLMGLVRPYGVTLSFVAVLVVGLVLLVMRAFQEPFSKPAFLMKKGSWLLLGLLPSLVFVGFKANGLGDANDDRETRHTEKAEVDSLPRVGATTEEEPGDEWLTPAAIYWERSSWLPEIIDRVFQRVAYNRQIFLGIYGYEGSTLDGERLFNRTSAVLGYLPKAFKNAWLAPYPGQLEGQARSPTGGAQRLVSNFEMLIAYLLLAACVVRMGVLMEWRIWMVILTSSLVMLPLAIGLPAVGSLYRIRYGPFMVGLAIGAAAIVAHVRRRLEDSP